MEKKSESPSKFTVEKGGNPRGKTATKEDINQALRDISEWFKINGKSYYEKLATIKPASADGIKKIQSAFPSPIPVAVQTLLEIHNGGFQLLDTFVTIPTTDIEETLKGMKGKKGWKDGYLPIAKDIEKQCLCVLIEGGKETKLEIWSEDGVEVLKQTVSEYIEEIRDKLLMKKLEYDETLGLISVV